MDLSHAVAIRNERSTDAATIHLVHAASFPTPCEARLVDALRRGGRLSLSLIAEAEGIGIGHVACSPVTLHEHPHLHGGIGLGPIAVVPAHQSQGVGGRLMRDCLAAATAASLKFIVVLGEPAFYTRFGFVPASRFGLQNEYGAGDEFMALELQICCLPRPAGLVRYAPEFALVTP